MTETMQLKIINNNTSVTLEIEGTLDLTNCETFHETLRNSALTNDNVIVDIRKTNFIDTAVIQDLAKAAIILIKRNQKLKVLALDNSYPLRVLRISNFKEIMDIVVESKTE